MREFEDQYRILFQANPLPMYVYNVKTLGILMVNDAAVEHYGYSRDEFLHMTILDLQPPEDIELLKKVMPKHRVDDLTLCRCGVWRHRKKDGMIIDVEISSQGQTFDGLHTRLVVAQDVTDLKRTADHLRLLEMCINRVNDVVIITEGEPIDESGPPIIFVNDAFVRHTGYTREEVIGRSPRFMKVPPSSQAAFERIWADLKAGKSVREEVIKYAKDGREIWWEMQVAPVFDESGHCQYFVAIERDVTDRKRAEQAVKQSETRLKEAQRVANIGSWEWIITRRKVIWSDELYRIFGLAPQSIAITVDSFLNMIHPEEREMMLRKIEDVRKRPRSFNETFRIVQPDGTVRHVLAHGEGVADCDGQTQRIVGTVQDITERKEAEEERLRSAKLEAANKELEAFSYSVSHDLRAPLRTIDGFARLLAEEYASKLDDNGKNYLDYIQNATGRMNQLIQDLLDLSQITTSAMHRTQVDLSGMVEGIVKDLRLADPDRHVEVSITPGLVANADPRLIRIALDNLLRNAWKFTSKQAHPRIEFGMTQPDGSPVYFVRDNGAGFDMAYAQKLFGVFQRMHCEAEFAGTGVGLATVQRIITRHSGKVWATAAVNQGATFYFTLPAS